MKRLNNSTGAQQRAMWIIAGCPTRASINHALTPAVLQSPTATSLSLGLAARVSSTFSASLALMHSQE
jgi:hypothetical protein